MPKRDDIKKILIIGSGPIIIGQACEFDYSGTQAVQALKEEGYRIVLVNPNPATVMTTPGLADAIYAEPLSAEYVREIIRQERPDAVLPTMGGQTALNLAIELYEAGILAEYGVELIGATIDSIQLAEDRGRFKAGAVISQFRPLQGVRMNSAHKVMNPAPITECLVYGRREAEHLSEVKVMRTFQIIAKI